MRNLLQVLNRIPPKACRLLARCGNGRGCHPMSWRELAFASGLSVNQVRRIVKVNDWRGVTVEEAMRLSTACRINLLSPSEAVRDWKRCRAGYLARSQHLNQRRYLERVMKDLIKAG